MTIEGVLSETRLTGFSTPNNANFRGSIYATHEQLQFVATFGSAIEMMYPGDPVNSGLNFWAGAYFFVRSSLINSTSTNNTSGLWTADNQRGFFGFRFVLENDSASGLPADSFVYGWGEMERISASAGRLLQWAYDDTGAPIGVGVIPEPGTLGLLALGAAGLAALRKRRNENN